MEGEKDNYSDSRLEVNIEFTNLLNRYFENVMILVIILNCISLGLFDYTDRNSMTFQNQMIDKSNMFFTCIFIIEAILKVVAYGLCIHQNAYLRSGWNIIDAVVVLSA